MTPAPDTLADQATGGGPRPHRTRAGPYRHPPDAQLAPQAVETHDGRIPLGASRGFGVWWREGVGPPGRASFDEEYPPMPARAATPRPSRIRCPTAPLRKRPTRRPHPGTFGASFRGGRPGPLEMSRFCLDTSGSSHFQRGDPEVVELIDERSERPRNVDPGLRSARTSRTTLMSRKRRIRSASLRGAVGSPPRRYRSGGFLGALHGLGRMWCGNEVQRILEVKVRPPFVADLFVRVRSSEDSDPVDRRRQNGRRPVVRGLRSEGGRPVR